MTEQRKEQRLKWVMQGYGQGARDILEHLKETHDANPDATVDDLMNAVNELLLTIAAKPNEPLIVVPPGVRG